MEIFGSETSKKKFPFLRLAIEIPNEKACKNV